MTSEKLLSCPFCGGEARMHIGLMEFVDGEVQCECGGSSGNHPTAGQALAAWNTRTDATKDAEIERLRSALSGKFCTLFLDGRNEHGSHVLPLFPTSIDITPEDLNSDCAEEIIQSAETQGFSIGDMVWAEFEWVPAQVGEYGRVEFEGYWEFKRINTEMTCAALTTPDPAGGMPVEVET